MSAYGPVNLLTQSLVSATVVLCWPGSQTLSRWRRLATPNLAGVLEQRPGVQVKGGQHLNTYCEEELYSIADYEEDGQLSFIIPFCKYNLNISLDWAGLPSVYTYVQSIHTFFGITCFVIIKGAFTLTQVRVPRNRSLHVFQWRPLTLIWVLYEYALPVNFTRMSSLWAGRVFIQPVWSEQQKICINLIYKVMTHIWGHKSCHCQIVHY